MACVSYAYDYRICIDSSGSSVPASLLDLGNNGSGRKNWTMYLQRQTSGVWITIGTRTGYVSPTSDSHRTFTNVMKTSRPLRLKVVMNGETYYSKKIYHS